MKKVVLAGFLACAVASCLPLASAQGTSSPAAAPAADPCATPQMAAPEYAVYNNAITQTDPKAQAAGLEQYLTQFPQSAVKADTLERLMALYISLGDATKGLDAADRVLAVDPNDMKALYVEALIRKSQADALTDATAKQAGLDSAASYAQKGLAAPKPACMTDAAFTALKATEYPSFYSVIGYAAVIKKDSPTAIDAYKKELAMVPEAATKTPGNVLQDIYWLSVAYVQANPRDLLDCAFYAARVAAYAPDQLKPQFTKAAKYCYDHYHGGDDGYDALLASATANLNPPDGLFASIKPAPTPAEQIHTIIATTPDLGTLAVSDKEMVFQYGSPDDAAKVWDTIKGKSFQIEGVVAASTPTQLQLEVTDGAQQSKTPDFTVNLTPPEVPEEPKASATPAQKLAYKRKVAEAQKEADAIAAATAVGQTVTVSGTYDSFTPNPVMITMKDGEVILPKATPTKPTTHTTAHKPAAH